MALDESWELNERGQVTFSALLGYSMALMPEGALVRLEYADTPEAIEQRRVTGLQLHLDVPQARELAEALKRLADTLEEQDRVAKR
jgi:hypothetical protein